MATEQELAEVSDFHSGYGTYAGLSEGAKQIHDEYARTDTTPADNIQRDGLYAYLASQQSGHVYTPETLALVKQAEADIAAEQGDPQWAGPSLPHPTEAGSEEERVDLEQGWDDHYHGIEPNQEQLEA